MKKINKLMSLTVALALVMTTLVGCSSAKTGETTTNETSNDVVTNDSTEELVFDNAETFKIGAIGPATGTAAVYGIAVKNGAQIAIDEINAAGGIKGSKIEYNFQDDECDSEKSVNAYNTLKDWGMEILVGTVTSGCSVAVADKTSTDNMFQLTPSGSSESCIQNNTNVFQVCFTDPNQGIGSAQYIGNAAMASKVAVIYDSSDVYSTGIYEKFVSESANQPFEIVTAEAFTGDNKTDFSVQLQKAKDAGAELIFLPIYYTEASLILTQAVGMDYSPLFFGCDGLDGILGVENFDTTLAEGLILLTPFAADATDEATKAFVSTYISKYGETPNQFAADAYDAVYIIKTAVEASDVEADMSISDICEGLKVAMTTISIDGLTGESMTWSANGAVDKSPKAMKIVDGIYSLMQ